MADPIQTALDATATASGALEHLRVALGAIRDPLARADIATRVLRIGLELDAVARMLAPVEPTARETVGASPGDYGRTALRRVGR